MKKLLVLEPQNVVAANLEKALQGYEIFRTSSADQSLELANDEEFDAIIIELSLSGHSGFEFLYEFRSYADWQDIPIIIYSIVNLSQEVLNSRSWQALNIHEYSYKPKSSLAQLTSTI